MGWRGPGLWAAGGRGGVGQIRPRQIANTRRTLMTGGHGRQGGGTYTRTRPARARFLASLSRSQPSVSFARTALHIFAPLCTSSHQDKTFFPGYENSAYVPGVSAETFPSYPTVRPSLRRRLLAAVRAAGAARAQVAGSDESSSASNDSGSGSGSGSDTDLNAESSSDSSASSAAASSSDSGKGSSVVVVPLGTMVISKGPTGGSGEIDDTPPVSVKTLSGKTKTELRGPGGHIGKTILSTPLSGGEGGKTNQHVAPASIVEGVKGAREAAAEALKTPPADNAPVLLFDPCADGPCTLSETASVPSSEIKVTSAGSEAGSEGSEAGSEGKVAGSSAPEVAPATAATKTKTAGGLVVSAYSPNA